MNAIDTNIWIYRHDSRDPQKQLTADHLIMSVRPQVLLWQVGCEFISASRKLAVFGFTEDQAWAALADMQSMSMRVALPDVRLWKEAQALQTRHTLSFWDALLVAACVLSGVRRLYTENMGAPCTINGLSLVNPFVATP